MGYDGTFIHKVVFPVVAPLGIGLAMFTVARDSGIAWSLMLLPLVFLIVWVFFTITLPLKRVRILGDSIEISGFRCRAVVPLRQVHRVEDVWGGAPRVRRIFFAEKTVFGESVVYMPRFHMFGQRDWQELQNVPQR
jgi:hypothetical protein